MEKNDVIKRIIEVFNHNALDFTGTNKSTEIDNYLLMLKLSTERFKLKTIPELTSRVFNHWKKAGLMPVEREEGMAKFSFIEYIWLKIVLILREYGYPLEKIGVAKYCLFNPHLDPNKEYEENYHQRYYQDKGYIDSRTMLGVGIAMMVTDKVPMSVIIPPNGIVYITKSKNTNPYTYPYLSIPLMSVVHQFIANTKDIDMLNGLGVLNETELSIIEQIRRNDIHEIRIDYQGGKPLKYLVTEKKKAMIEQEVKSHLFKYGYENIVVDKHGKNYVCTITTKHKIK